MRNVTPPEAKPARPGLHAVFDKFETLVVKRIANAVLGNRIVLRIGGGLATAGTAGGVSALTVLAIIASIIWLLVLLIVPILIWNGIMVQPLGVQPIEGVGGAILFILAMWLLGRLIGIMAIIIGLILLLTGGTFNWFGLINLTALTALAYGVFCFVAGSLLSGSDKRSE